MRGQIYNVSILQTGEESGGMSDDGSVRTGSWHSDVWLDDVWLHASEVDVKWTAGAWH